MSKTTDLPRNERSNDLCAYVSGALHFYKTRVVDFGFGYGDMLLCALDNGADSIVGFEKDRKVYDIACQKIPVAHQVELFNEDFEKQEELPSADIAFCFSVLPYLEDPKFFLRVLSHTYDTSVIECQYEGDGPGFLGIKDDFEMRDLLVSCGFYLPYVIGKTLAKEKYWRTVWLCHMPRAKSNPRDWK